MESCRINRITRHTRTVAEQARERVGMDLGKRWAPGRVFGGPGVGVVRVEHDSPRR